MATKFQKYSERKERLGKYITKFRERYFEPDQRNRERVFTYALKSGADETIKDLISDICVSMKAEALADFSFQL